MNTRCTLTKDTKGRRTDKGNRTSANDTQRYKSQGTGRIQTLFSHTKEIAHVNIKPRMQNARRKTPNIIHRDVKPSNIMHADVKPSNRQG